MKKGHKKPSYDEVMKKFYSHLTSDDLANEEWRRAIVDGVESDRYIVSNLGRFADRNPKRQYHDAGRFQDIPEFGNVRMLSVYAAATTSGKKNADDDYLNVHFNKEYQTHRIIARTFIGEIPKGWTVDHIKEGNAFDNRVKNLQILSLQDNSLKGKIMRARRTGIPIGVCWCKTNRKWMVQAPNEKDGPREYVGCFDHLRDAAKVAEIMFTENRLCDSAYVRDLLLKHYKDLEPNLDDVEHEFRAKLNQGQMKMVVNDNNSLIIK